MVAECGPHWTPSILRVPGAHGNRNKHVWLEWLGILRWQVFTEHHYLRTDGRLDFSWRGEETQEMWEGGQNHGTHCSCSSPHLEADGLVEHSQGPARQHSRHPRGAKTALVPEGKQFCRVVHAPSSSSVHQAESDFTWDHILAWLFPFPSFFLFLETWEILVPQPGIEPMLPAVEAWSLNHWTAREAPLSLCLSCFLPSLKSFSWSNAFPSTNYGALNSFSWLCSFRTQHKTTSPLPSENAPERGSIRKWKRACSGD